MTEPANPPIKAEKPKFTARKPVSLAPRNIASSAIAEKNLRADEEKRPE